MKMLLLLTLLLAIAAPVMASQFIMAPTDLDLEQEIDNLEERLNLAEAKASVEGRLILQTGRLMIETQQIVLGSCWDYINAVYDRAGFLSRRRSIIFKSKQAGPYLMDDTIEPGDWLYFINHSYNDVEHSALFVDWIDFEAKIALTIAYAGGNRQKPARYKTYDLRSVYNIIRPKIVF